MLFDTTEKFPAMVVGSISQMIDLVAHCHANTWVAVHVLEAALLSQSLKDDALR